MEKAPVKLLAGFSSIAGLVLLLVLTFNITQRPQSVSTQAKDSNAKISLLTDSSVFKDNKTVVIDFSSEPCCKTLSHHYLDTGVTFDNESDLGWGTYQANGFANHLSGVEKEPGAPAGTTGTRMSFSEPVRKAGYYIQAGSPFNLENFRPAKSITIKAYDEDNNLLFYEVTDTCLGEVSSCRPVFIGVQSNKSAIKYFETIINESYNWSIDDLTYEL